MKAHSKGTSHQQGETQPGQANPGDAGWDTDLEIQVLPTTMDISFRATTSPAQANHLCQKPRNISLSCTCASQKERSFRTHGNKGRADPDFSLLLKIRNYFTAAIEMTVQRQNLCRCKMKFRRKRKHRLPVLILLQQKGLCYWHKEGKHK